VSESHTGYYIDKILSDSRQPLAEAMTAAGN
jgi:hypothetical protein